MLETLTLSWTVWKLATKRLGPVGGLGATVLVVAGYLLVMPRIRERYPRLASVVDRGETDGTTPDSDPV